MTVIRGDKIYNTVDELFDDMEREFKEKHPVEYWIDRTLFKEKSFLGYSARYSITHPHILLRDAWDQIVWAWQRVFRGWDDRVLWSIDYWLCDIMPDILVRFKEIQHGIPSEFLDQFPCDENYCYSEEDAKKASELWNSEIDKIIAGFIAHKRIADVDYDYKDDDKKELKILQQVYKQGMESFVENLGSLWD